MASLWTFRRCGISPICSTSQIDHIQPDSYIADNEWLTFVTRDARLFDVVAKALSYPSEW